MAVNNIGGTDSGSTIVHADIDTSIRTTSSGSIEVFNYVSRGSGVTVTGKRIRVSTSATVNIDATNGGYIMAQMAWSAGTVTAYSAALRLSGEDMYNDKARPALFSVSKQGSSITSPLTYGPWYGGLFPGGNLYANDEGGYYGVNGGNNYMASPMVLDFRGTIAGDIDIQFASSVTTTFTPSFAVARANGMTSINAAFGAWRLQAEVLA